MQLNIPCIKPNGTISHFYLGYTTFDIFDLITLTEELKDGLIQFFCLNSLFLIDPRSNSAANFDICVLQSATTQLSLL